jgi:AAA domain
MTLRVSDPSSLKYAKCLFFAPAGHGKTHLLGTAQEDERTYPMCFIDFEAGTETLAGLDVDVFPVRSWTDADQVLEHLEQGDIVKLKTTNGKTRTVDFQEYRSVGVDSVSEWNRWAQLDLLRREKAQRKDPDLLEFKDFNRTSVQLRRVLRRLRDLEERHVFLSAHSTSREEPRLGRVTLPDLTGQLAEEIAGLVSVVGYLALSEDEDGETERLLLLNNYPKYRVKARTAWKEKAPDEIVNPDITEILDTLGYEN